MNTESNPEKPGRPTAWGVQALRGGGDCGGKCLRGEELGGEVQEDGGQGDLPDELHDGVPGVGISREEAAENMRKAGTPVPADPCTHVAPSRTLGRPAVMT